MSAMALAVGLVVAGCSEEEGMSTSGAGSSAPVPATPTAAASTAATPTAASSSSMRPPLPVKTPASGPPNDADVIFVQAMLPHHQQAVEMSKLLLAKPDTDPRVRALAQQIQDAQTPEIIQMTGWLEGWGFEVKPMDNDMDHSGQAGSGMDGMMSESDLTDLREAAGDDASRLYLAGMVKHHKGAVTMAKTEISDGENPDAIILADTTITSQQIEIDQMNQIIDQL